MRKEKHRKYTALNWNTLSRSWKSLPRQRWYSTTSSTALGSAVVYIFRAHTKQDDNRYDLLTKAIDKLGDKITDNHTAVMQQFIDAGRHAATNAAIAEGIERREL